MWLLLKVCACLGGAVAWERGEGELELQARTELAQARMREARLDAILVTTEANVRYFTGYHSPFWQSPTRPWFVVIPATGKPIAVVPAIGIDSFERAFTDRIVSWPSPRPGDEGVSELAGVLSALPFESGRIGAELGVEMNLRMPVSDFERLKNMLAAHERTIVDSGHLLLAGRVIKSQLEVDKIAATCQAVSDAYREIPSTITVGMSEIEACRHVKRLLLQKGVDDTTYVICRSGPISYSDIIGHPTKRVLQEGDMFIVDTGSQIDGYFCDFNRNFAVGRPAQEVLDAHDRLYGATEAALAIARPGTTFGELYAAMADKLGLSSEALGGVGRMGHSVGLQLTELPSVHPTESAPLKEGMVIALEPSINLPSGKGAFLVTEEDLLITSTGYRLLSERAPKAIPSLAAATLNA